MNMTVCLRVQVCLQEQMRVSSYMLRYNGAFKVSLTETLGGSMISHC